MASPDGRPVSFDCEIPWHKDRTQRGTWPYEPTVSEPVLPSDCDCEDCQCPQSNCGIRVVTTQLFGGAE
jgi:hypothetical protein